MTVAQKQQFIAKYFMGKCKGTAAQWNSLNEQQKGKLIDAFFELKADEDELRAISDPNFRAELARLKGLTHVLEQDAYMKMAVNPETGAQNMKK